MESVRCLFFRTAHRECHRGSLFPFNWIEEVYFQRLPGGLTAGSPENHAPGKHKFRPWKP